MAHLSYFSELVVLPLGLANALLPKQGAQFWLADAMRCCGLGYVGLAFLHHLHGGEGGLVDVYMCAHDGILVDCCYYFQP